jgi:ferredoxin
VRIRSATLDERPLAIFGARPCEVAALGVLDRVLIGGDYVDPRYAERRRDTFVVVAECARPASTCFCCSMGSGPESVGDFDLALTELVAGRRYLVRVGSSRGAQMLEGLDVDVAGEDDQDARRRLLDDARSAMGRHLDTEGLAEVLAEQVESPRWQAIAERCLSCGNCTLVCPTCFCSDVHDTTDLDGTIYRERTWSSCFDLDHSYLHGGSVRAATSSRYRQWLSHKLSTWWDQFGQSGCVGCGRCVTWCPVGIDITHEAAMMRVSASSAGAQRVKEATP